MRYILRRDTFLERDKINEVFKNELTWGGSLFGRLINSTLRVMKINYDTVRIKEVLKNIEATIYEILRESLDKDLRVKLYRYRIKNKVTQIRNVSLDRSLDFYKQSTDCGRGPGADTKLSKLIGFDEPDTQTPEFNQEFKDLTSGLLYDFFQEIDALTGASRGTGNQDLKNVLTRQELDDLRNIHSDYSVELRKIRWAKCNGVSSPDKINRRSKWKGKEAIMNTDQKLKDQIAVKNESLDGKIFRKFSQFEEYKKLLEADYSRLHEELTQKELEQAEKNSHRDEKTGLYLPGREPRESSKKHPQNVINIHNNPQFQNNPHFQQQSNPSINVNSGSGGGGSGGGSTTTSTTTIGVIGTTTTSTTTTVSGTTTTSTTTLPPTTTTTTSTTTIEVDEVAELYDELFIQNPKKENSEYSSKKYLLIKEAFDITQFELTRDDIKEFQELESKLAAGEFSLTRAKASDAIIRLLNLLTTAYELFAVDFIPSGRPGGRVSMKTFKEYQKLSSGTTPDRAQSTPLDAGGTSIQPGYGPWAQRQTYKEFQKFVDKLLEDQELRKIFSNVKFNYPGSEDKFNDSYRYRLLTENDNQNSSPQIRKKSMGPEIFSLLQTMRTPSTCGDATLHIDKVKRVYFGLEPTPKAPTPSNVPGGSSDDGASLQQILEFRKDSLVKPGDLKSRNVCLSIQQDSSLTQNKIKDPDNPILIQYPTRPSTLIFLTHLSGINSLKTSYGADIEFLPMKITFRTPAVANQINDKGSYKSYCDLTEMTTPEPKIYYGYVYLQNDKMSLFYVNTLEPITKIDYQKVKIEERTHTNRKNPQGKSPEVPGDHEMKTGVLINGSRIIPPHTDRIVYFSSDRDSYQTFFEREITVSSGSEKFKDYMKKILEDKAENQDRLAEISA